MIETISALVAVGAFSFTVATYFLTRHYTHIHQADQMLFQINSMVLEYPDIVSDATPRGAAYTVIVWNFMERAYLLGLKNDKAFQKVFKDFTGLYGTWFKKNQKQYDHDFVKFITDTFADDLK